MNVRYLLKKVGESATYGISQVSSGGEMTFVSDNLTSSGDYYLVSQHTLVDCKNNFYDRFYGRNVIAIFNRKLYLHYIKILKFVV